MAKEEKINYPASIAVNAGILAAGAYVIGKKPKYQRQSKKISSLDLMPTKKLLT